MCEGIRSARRFIGAPAWADYIISRVDNATTDPELDQYIRSNAGTIFHAVGTAAMSPRGADYGVVDPDLKVKGAVGIRIVDASVLVSEDAFRGVQLLNGSCQTVTPASGSSWSYAGRYLCDRGAGRRFDKGELVVCYPHILLVDLH